MDDSGSPSCTSLKKLRKQKATMSDSGSPPSGASFKKHRKRDSRSSLHAYLRKLRKLRKQLASRVYFDSLSGDSPKELQKKRAEEVGVDDLGLGCYSKHVSPLDYEVWIRYRTQVAESNGFDILDYPGTYIWAPLVPLPLNDPNDGDLTMAGMMAIYYYFLDTFTKYSFSRIVRANARFVGGVMYYITLEAKELESHDPAVKTFQAKVWQEKFPSMKLQVQFCRLKN